MASRQMVGQRKPGLVVAIQAGGPSAKGDNNTPPDSGPQDSQDDNDKDAGPDVDTCPNCGCEFDEDSGKIMKAGAKVVGGPKDDESYQGRPFDAMDSAPPVPGKFGSARDGAVGTEAMAHLLGSLKGGV